MQIEAFIAALIDGRASGDRLQELDPATREAVIGGLLKTPAGRRWLRRSSLLTTELADRLLESEGDFNQRRQDSTLGKTVQLATLEKLVVHAVAIASGSGAPALWSRLAEDNGAFKSALLAILASGDVRALEATGTHLLLDPTESYGLTDRQRTGLAAEFLDTDAATARAVAAEFLAATSPEVLSSRLSRLIRDESATVRGFTWMAAYHWDREATASRGIELLGDESVGVEIRRSALNAAGETLPTDQMIGILSYFVVHPNDALALDAANLLHRHHRHPEIAIAAEGSPHDEVRDIASRLTDPYRGSPAAGGSRPGDPLREDPLLRLMRQIDEEESG